MIRYDMMPTDQGELLVAIDERGLVHVDFVAGLRPLPEFEAWLEDIGLWKNGMLTERAGDASFFLSR